MVGNFTNKRKVLGTIIKNTSYGYMAKQTEQFQIQFTKNSLPIAYQYNIKPGKATILTTIDDTGIQEYEIRILKINRQAEPGPKDWYLKLVIPDF